MPRPVPHEVHQEGLALSLCHRDLQWPMVHWGFLRGRILSEESGGAEGGALV